MESPGRHGTNKLSFRSEMASLSQRMSRRRCAGSTDLRHAQPVKSVPAESGSTSINNGHRKEQAKAVLHTVKYSTRSPIHTDCHLRHSVNLWTVFADRFIWQMSVGLQRSKESVEGGTRDYQMLSTLRNVYGESYSTIVDLAGCTLIAHHEHKTMNTEQST